MADTHIQDQSYQHTLDLAELARINRGDRVRVKYLPDSTQELFDQTLALVGAEVEETEAHAALVAARLTSPRATHTACMRAFRDRWNEDEAGAEAIAQAALDYLLDLE